MQLGTLTWQPVLDHLDLVAEPVRRGIQDWAARDEQAVGQVLIAPVEEDLADTAALTEAYDLPPEASVNCVVVAGKREGVEHIAAVLVRATTRADVNRAIRKHLNVRKASFLSMDRAVAETDMAYGGITPLGLPPGYRLLLDDRVVAGPAVIGSGTRTSKILLPGELLAQLPAAEVLEQLALPA